MKNVLLFVFVFFSVAVMAQEPSWTDYYERQNMYPEADFLVGFVSGIASDEQDIGKVKQQYEANAKNKLIQSIQVEIENNNSLNVSNKNGKSQEDFLSKSVSFSKANVNGLNTQSFYNRRNNEIFAIAYVNKKELTFYYYNSIKMGIQQVEQKLAEGRKYHQKNNKEEALRSFYECLPFFKEMDEARVLLMALNRKMYADINNDRINALNQELIEEIEDILNPSDLNLSETAYFVAYGLFLQLGVQAEAVYIEPITFENTGLSSDFSNVWDKEFGAALVKAASYQIADYKRKNNYIAVANYWQEGEFLKINASIIKDGKTLAVAKGSLPLSWIKKEGISYTPLAITKMQALKNSKLMVRNTPEFVKLKFASKKAMVIELMKNDIPLEGVAVSVVDSHGGQALCASKTNDAGVSLCFLPAIESQRSMLKLEVGIDLATYLGIDKNDLYYSIALSENPVLPIVLNIPTVKPSIFVQSRELIFGNSMDIKTLEPRLKALLAEKAYQFVEMEAHADYILIINANTTTSTSYQGIYFAYLDVTFSIIDVSTNTEIYKTHLDQIKGGGANYKKAAKKAYILGAKKLEGVFKDGIL